MPSNTCDSQCRNIHFEKLLGERRETKKNNMKEFQFAFFKKGLLLYGILKVLRHVRRTVLVSEIQFELKELGLSGKLFIKNTLKISQICGT